MDWSDVSAAEAKRLGLVPDGALPQPSLSPSDQEVARALRHHPALQDLMAMNSRPPFLKCPKCGRFVAYDGTCDRCGATLSKDRQVQRGHEALSRATEGHPKDVPHAMHKPGLGSIHFLQGWEGKGSAQEHGKGLAKIQQKHRKDLLRLPETIAKGKVYPLKSKHTGKMDPNRKAIVHGSYIAFLSKHGDGWAVTSHYSSERDLRKVLEDAEKIRATTRRLSERQAERGH